MAVRRLMCPVCYRMRDDFSSAHLLLSPDSTVVVPCVICKQCSVKLHSMHPFQQSEMYEKVRERVASAPEDFNSVLCTNKDEIEEVFWNCIRRAPMKNADLARKFFAHANFRYVRDRMKQKGEDNDATC